MSEVLESGRTAAIAVPKPLDLAYEGAIVRYLEVDGKVSVEEYTVSDTSLRNNRVVLTTLGGTKTSIVNRRRLLPRTADRAATVIEAGDRYKALCPKCGKSIVFSQGASDAQCSEHGVFLLHWLGVKPMSTEENTGTKTPKPPKQPKPAKEKAETPPKEHKQPKPAKEPVAKKPRPSKEPQPVDLNAIAMLGELYTKQHVQFDHAHVHVQAHTLLTVERKYCFNTYNGSLGKRAKQLDLAAFHSPTEGFAIKDIEKEKASLEKQGYERVQAKQAKSSSTNFTKNNEAAVHEPIQETESAPLPSANGKFSTKPAVTSDFDDEAFEA